jgi:hypothetical protein
MTSTAAKMTDTLFENGDDKRARLKLKPNYLDHLKALEQVHSKMKQSFKLLGISNAAFVHQRAKKSRTNADIKRSISLFPTAKGTALRRSVFQLHWLRTVPHQRRNQRRTHHLSSLSMTRWSSSLNNSPQSMVLIMT